VDRKKTDTVKLSIGAGKSKENKNLYICEIKHGIEEILSRNGLHDDDVSTIIASGMITSEYGLCNIPHINTPAGLNELHENLHKASIPEISPIPFVFVRGVKMKGDDFSCTDIMRGEETEIMGILNPEYKDPEDPTNTKSLPIYCKVITDAEFRPLSEDDLTEDKELQVTTSYYAKIGDKFVRAYSIEQINNSLLTEGEDYYHIPNNAFIYLDAASLDVITFDENETRFETSVVLQTIKKDETGISVLKAQEDIMVFDFGEEKEKSFEKDGYTATITLSEPSTTIKNQNLTNGEFWWYYHNNEHEVLREQCAIIETDLTLYWEEALAASKGCQFFLPDH
jgi:hypothetical protein